MLFDQVSLRFMWRCVTSGYPMQYNNIWLTLLLLLATTLSAYGQRSVSYNVHVTARTASSATAGTLAYPQSIFVDSEHGNLWVTDFDNNRVLRYDVLSLTNIAEGTVALTAEKYALGQNYPNPFNPGTTITFAVTKTEHATVTIFNVLGQEVATLFDGMATAHKLYSLSFNAADLPSGMYFYALRSANRHEVRKMCVVK